MKERILVLTIIILNSVISANTLKCYVCNGCSTVKDADLQECPRVSTVPPSSTTALPSSTTVLPSSTTVLPSSTAAPNPSSTNPTSTTEVDSNPSSTTPVVNPSSSSTTPVVNPSSSSTTPVVNPGSSSTTPVVDTSSSSTASVVDPNLSSTSTVNPNSYRLSRRSILKAPPCLCEKGEECDCIRSLSDILAESRADTYACIKETVNGTTNRNCVAEKTNHTMTCLAANYASDCVVCHSDRCNDAALLQYSAALLTTIVILATMK